MAAFLNMELTGALSTGPGMAGNLGEGESSRQMLTEQREEMREAVLA